MITPNDCIKKYGSPGTDEANKFMVLWVVPDDIKTAIHTMPAKVYCNKDLVKPLETALRTVIRIGKADEIKTWDGCYNIRKQRGSLFSLSLHSWGVAIDINAAWNQLGKQPTLSFGIVSAFKNAGFDWGGDWKRKDGMHFQLASI